MVVIPDVLVPQEVKEALEIQIRSNGGEWLKTNYVQYFPDGRSNHKENKAITYKKLKSGSYAIVKTEFVD